MLPPGCEVDGQGHLLSAGHDICLLADRFGTPLYVFNEEVIRGRCREFLAAFAAYGPGARVAYAGKAFLTLAMVRIVAEEGLGLDVVSGGELHTALRAGMPPVRIALHGNNKQPGEVSAAVAAGVGQIVLDNFHEIEVVAAAAAPPGRRVRVLLRVAPGIEAHTHAYMQTGTQDSKFGFDLASGQALAAARLAAASPWLDLHGLHAHIGSQILGAAPYAATVGRLLDLAAAIREATGRAPGELNVGGGIGVRYAEGDEPVTPAAFGRAVIEAVEAGCRERRLPLPALGCEPGRSVVAEAAIALYTVGADKRVPGIAPFLAIDGGMGDNIRPALYDAAYTLAAPGRMREAATERVTVVGRFCESGDILARDVPLPRLAAGERLAVFGAGAYQLPMASNYNRVPRPAAVLVSHGRADLMLAREGYDDLLRQDRLPPHLAVQPAERQAAAGRAEAAATAEGAEEGT